MIFRSLAGFVLLVTMGSPSYADTLLNTYGPYTWSDGCGQMTITVRVYKDVPGAPGLYKWDYEVNNISIVSEDPDPYVNGVANIWLGLPAGTEAANPYGPANWEATASPSDSFTIVEVGSLSVPDPYIYNYPAPIYTLAPGQTMHFGFTTFPRQEAELQPCAIDENGTLLRWFTCAGADQGEAAYPEIVVGSPGTSSAGKSSVVPTQSRRQRAARPQRTPKVIARPQDISGCTQSAIGPIAIPGPALTQLQSFHWQALLDDNPAHGMKALYHDSANDVWSEDALADEGDTNVTDPAWMANSTGTGIPQENDPVAYTGGTKPFITNVVLTRVDGSSDSALLRVTTDQGTLAFPDTAIQFSNGMASLNYPSGIIAQQTLRAAIANMDVNLTWSISLDSGVTWTGFAMTSHKIFVSLGPPESFGAGTTGFTSSSHITAARVNYVTNLLLGQTDADASVQAVQGSVAGLFGTGDKILSDVYNSMDPWVALDSPGQNATLDCLNLAAIGAVQLLEAGIDVGLFAAYPTTNGDATFPKSQFDPQNINQTDTLKYYLNDGVTRNIYEGFLTLNQGSQAVSAYTFMPTMGPLAPWTSPVDGLPSTTAGQLAFQVMYRELLNERNNSQNSKSGQQWWINNSTGLDAQGPVVFLGFTQ